MVAPVNGQCKLESSRRVRKAMNPIKITLRALAVATLVHASLCVAAEILATDRLATPNGLVRVTGPLEHRDFLSVDGKQVFAGLDDAMELWHDYRVSDSDAVLFSTDCSGSSCGQRHFYFVLLKRGRKPLVVTTSDFFTTDGTFDLSPRPDEVTIELGFENGLRKWAELKGLRVSIHRDPSKARLSVEDCDRVHQMTLENCPGKYAPQGECDSQLVPSSLADMGLLRGLANAPGFDSVALGETCRAQCTTGVPSSFDVFKREVCGIR